MSYKERPRCQKREKMLVLRGQEFPLALNSFMGSFLGIMNYDINQVLKGKLDRQKIPARPSCREGLAREGSTEQVVGRPFF